MGDDGIDKLIRPELTSFTGYAASKAPETLADKVEVPVEDIIKLDANENVYGCSPGVNLQQNGRGTGDCVGCPGGYGGFYCFALAP